ncbi:MAG: 5-formyltetrahydrofolate cyclo-ligase [Chlorobiaceae bacterium]|nr:5-formyltetrahydrofolate cyclo-ligase [Chlorobiaceae bacterium]
MISSQHSKSKGAIRTELLQKRKDMDGDEWLRMSGEIKRRLETMTEIHKAVRIHCYVSIERAREVSTRELLEWFCLERKEVYLPYIDRDRMVAARYAAGQGFKASAPGSPVPEPLLLSDEDRFDAVIVPLVGFDRRGGRIGYGKGWYDRFFGTLSACGIHPLRIGLAFDLQEVPSVPCDPWDELLDVVVTEKEIVNCLIKRA